ncbi:ABC transporter permease [Jonesia quinghaiensis]|uniref:ABC transporter permease n=1 Tax=Jonesia quinghaiensis TaxID=262806 RepID=UPI0004077CAA|nr:ABC transporter permease [Jonesia quinghaiensis]
MRNVALALAAAIVLWLGVAMLAPAWLTSGDPLATQTSAVLLPPSAEHWFGTDQSGRDVYTRVVYGARDSLLVGLRAVAIAMVCGGLIGTVAGVAPRWVDRIVSRLLEVTMAFPEFLLALLVIAVLGKGANSVALGVTVAIIPAYVRLARVTARQLRFSGAVDAATILGVSYPRAVWRHVAPQVAAGLLGLGIVGFGSAIVTAAGLSFLGLGISPPAPEWGVMMSEGKNQLARAWWITFFPGLALAATVVAVSTLARPLQRRLATGNAHD